MFDTVLSRAEEAEQMYNSSSDVRVDDLPTEVTKHIQEQAVKQFEAIDDAVRRAVKAVQRQVEIEGDLRKFAGFAENIRPDISTYANKTPNYPQPPHQIETTVDWIMYQIEARIYTVAYNTLRDNYGWQVTEFAHAEELLVNTIPAPYIWFRADDLYAIAIIQRNGNRQLVVTLWSDDLPTLTPDVHVATLPESAFDHIRRAAGVPF